MRSERKTQFFVPGVSGRIILKMGHREINRTA
jgi:hypothetical protein